MNEIPAEKHESLRKKGSVLKLKKRKTSVCGWKEVTRNDLVRPAVKEKKKGGKCSVTSVIEGELWS